MLNEQQLAVNNKTIAKLSAYKMTGGKFGKNIIKVNANPGTGKSLTVVELAQQAAKLGFSVLVMAFLKDNVIELLEKINNSHVTVATSHSMGMGIIKNANFNKRIKVANWRLSAFLKKQETKNQKGILQVVSLCKANLTDDIEKIVNFYNLQLSSEDMGFAKNALNFIDTTLKNIDFDDMIYIPVKLKLVSAQFDLVILDEAQDQSLAQVELAKSLAKNTLVLLGDDMQAIYGFRGAGNYAEIEDAVNFGLTKTYRFGSTIADYVNGRFNTNIIPAFEKAGQVLDIDHSGMIENLTDDSLIIARTNAELIPVALRAIVSDKQVQLTNKKLLSELSTMLIGASSETVHDICGENMIMLKGKYGDYYRCEKCTQDTGKNVNVSMKKAGKPTITKTSQETFETLRAMIFTLRENATSEDLEKYDDMIAIYSFLLENNTVQGALDELKKLSNSNKGATLTTCHKAKGMQAENVYVIMARFLEFADKNRDNEFWLAQETNLLFVAMTRPETNLYLV